MHLLRRRNVRVSCTQQSHIFFHRLWQVMGRSEHIHFGVEWWCKYDLNFLIYPSWSETSTNWQKGTVSSYTISSTNTLSNIESHRTTTEGFVYGESSRLRLEDFVGFKCVLCQLMRPRQSLLNHHLLQTAEKVEEEEQNIFPPSRWTSNHMNRWNLLILTQIHWKSTLLDCFVHGGPGELLVVFSCFTMCVGRLF